MAARMAHLRQMPGRLVGTDSRSSTVAARFCLTLSYARAAYPPRAGDLEHLHQSFSVCAGGDGLSLADGPQRTARAGGAKRRAGASGGRDAGSRGHPPALLRTVLQRIRVEACEPFGALWKRRSASKSSPASRSADDYPELSDALLVSVTEMNRGDEFSRLVRRQLRRCGDGECGQNRPEARSLRLLRLRNRIEPVAGVPLIFELSSEGRRGDGSVAACRRRAARRRNHRRGALPRRSSGLSRTQRAAGAAAFPASVAAQLRAGAPVLSARIVHDEVQPRRKRRTGGACPAWPDCIPRPRRILPRARSN